MMDKRYNNTIEHPEENFSATEAERQGVLPLLSICLSKAKIFNSNNYSITMKRKTQSDNQTSTRLTMNNIATKLTTSSTTIQLNALNTTFQQHRLKDLVCYPYFSHRSCKAKAINDYYH